MDVKKSCSIMVHTGSVEVLPRSLKDVQRTFQFIRLIEFWVEEGNTTQASLVIEELKNFLLS